MARNDIDYKEYSRLRDIAHKRVMRLEQAGFNVNISLPTVKQVRASENPYFFLREMKAFVEGDTTLGAVRASGRKTIAPSLKPKFPKVAEIATETALQKQIRKREQARRSRQRRAVREIAPEGKEGKFQGYLKAIQTIANRWKAEGQLTGDVQKLQSANFLLNMTAGQAKNFVAYAEYRFSQGDFATRYKNAWAGDSVMHSFAKDFADMGQSGKNMGSLQKDFAAFLADQKRFKRSKKQTDELGIPAGELFELWHRFAQR